MSTVDKGGESFKVALGNLEQIGQSLSRPKQSPKGMSERMRGFIPFISKAFTATEIQNLTGLKIGSIQELGAIVDQSTREIQNTMINFSKYSDPLQTRGKIKAAKEGLELIKNACRIQADVDRIETAIGQLETTLQVLDATQEIKKNIVSRVNQFLGEGQSLSAEVEKQLNEFLKEPANLRRFDRLLTKCEELQNANLKYLKNNEQKFNPQKVLSLDEAFVKETYSPLIQSAVNSEYKGIVKLIEELSDRTAVRNIQVNTDGFLLGLFSKEDLQAFLASEELTASPIVRTQNRLAKLEEDYKTKKKALEDQLETSSEKPKVQAELAQLEREQGYESRENSATIKEKASWEHVKRNQAEGFVKGTRVISLMRPDGVKKEVTIKLDLSSVGAQEWDKHQSLKVLHALNMVGGEKTIEGWKEKYLPDLRLTETERDLLTKIAETFYDAVSREFALALMQIGSAEPKAL